MKPAPSLPRAKPRPCGCVGGPGIVLHRCPEAEALWAAFAALGPDRATSETPEYKAYRAYFMLPRRER